MKELRYTLVTDGSSDSALAPILSWLLVENRIACPIQPEWADLRRLPHPPRDLVTRIEMSLKLYPCDLLFVHRDAESFTHERRKTEVVQALAGVSRPGPPPAVCVIPVRMLEAWLLFDEAALRRASGNPNGRIPLRLPLMTALEQMNDPKKKLYELLRDACELKGRRLQALRVSQCARQVAHYMSDFALLRILPAFRALEEDLKEIITRERWADPL